MADLVQDVEKNEKTRFQHVTELIQKSFGQGDANQTTQLSLDFIEQSDHPGYKFLIQGVLAFQQKNLLRAIHQFEKAAERLDPDDHPAVNSIYSLIYVNAQLALPRRDRPVTEKSYQFFKANLAALRELQPELAKNVAEAVWPDDFLLVDLWGRLHFVSVQHKSLMILAQRVKAAIDQKIHSRESITFGTIGTGQELAYCIEHQVDILHGMTRIHYVFEPNIPRLKALLHLYDYGRVLKNRELVLFGGQNLIEQANDWFDTMRYAVPSFTVGNLELVNDVIRQINTRLIGMSSVDRVKQYYQSGEFQGRQRRIADGDLMPRVLVDTCRWTTFLKYCAADFEKAFKQVGGQTRFLIEENDVQTLLPALMWREMDDFRPDVVFMVSHARPSISYIPRELPFICYMQDKCGPLLSLPSLKDHIAKQDLFVCMVEEFPRYLKDKDVPPEQTMVMPIPADETMFYPLEYDDPKTERFRADVSFVKHGGPAVDQMFKKFLSQHVHTFKDNKTRKTIERLFNDLYQSACSDRSRCMYEPLMQEYVRNRMQAVDSESFLHALNQLVTLFYVTVYSAVWRYQFLEAMDQAGIELALFGNGWDQHETLSHLNRGPVGRDTDLNAVYNASKITLNIHHGCTMHQRVSECGLAGGFIMIANHPKEHDWLPATHYFEADKEIVLFDNAKDLVEKCRYYLENSKQRTEIAQNLRRRCLEEHTCRIGAQKILDRWRDVLKQTFE